MYVSVISLKSFFWVKSFPEYSCAFNGKIIVYYHRAEF